MLALINAGIGFAKLQRAKTGWVDPTEVKFDQAGATPGLKPEDPEELNVMNTKELQNGRLATCCWLFGPRGC
jgi:hypothetical protein